MKTSYRRRAILNRIHKALDAFYLLQRIDWEYDIRTTLDTILATALGEIELDGGRKVERALLIVQTADRETLEVHAGWRVEDLDLTFSRTVVHQAITEGTPILCENAKEDPRFHEAESLKALETLSLICVPISVPERVIGALYIESHSPSNIFDSEDLDFLVEFTGTLAPYLKAALVHQEHVEEIHKLRSEVDKRHGLDTIVGRSEAMEGVFEMIRLASNVDRTALITGESGSGKELVARAIHAASPRRRGPFVVVDCSGLADHLLESELFGHVRGAFTGASADKIGAFEEADGGTIFLDEISDAPRPLQQMLRRVLQEGEIRRVGESAFRPVDVRVICATNRSLPELVEAGEFMRDLYHRMNKIPIQIPPLRERREDIPLLVHHFLEQASGRKQDAPSISVEAIELLARLDWRDNNVRELRNTVELAVDICGGEPIDAETIERALRIQRGEPVRLFPAGMPGGSGAVPPEGSVSDQIVHVDRLAFRRLLSRAEKSAGAGRRSAPFYILQQELAIRAVVEGLRLARWKLRPAARLLGISPMKLRGTLRDALGELLASGEGGIVDAARRLDIPIDVLRRKAVDLGLQAASGPEAPAPPHAETDTSAEEAS